MPKLLARAWALPLLLAWLPATTVEAQEPPRASEGKRPDHLGKPGREDIDDPFERSEGESDSKEGEPEYHGGGSEPGTPLHAYSPSREGPGVAPDQARGWAEPPGTEEEDLVLAVPRTLLYVPNLALRVVFIPLRYLATGLDKYKVVERTLDLLYFNEEETAGIFPVFSSQTGYGFSYGAKLFHNNVAGHDESIALRVRYGGIFQQGYQLAFEGDRVGGSRLWLESRVRFDTKPALLFYGYGDPSGGAVAPGLLGPRDASVATRFRQERFLYLLRIGPTLGEPGNLTKVGALASFNHREFGPEDRDFDEASIETVYDTSRITGFDGEPNLVELNANVVHDSLNNEGFPSSGVFLELLGGGVLPVEDYSFWHYGAEAAFHINLYRHTRVLVLRAALEGVVGDDEDIPFTELPRLGGPDRLRGYVRDRFRDKIAAMGTLEYRYHILQYAAANLFLDTGRVGRTYDDVFGSDALENWRVGGGGGFILHTDDSMLFRLEMGYGEGFTVFFSTDPLQAFKNRGRLL